MRFGGGGDRRLRLRLRRLLLLLLSDRLPEEMKPKRGKPICCGTMKMHENRPNPAEGFHDFEHVALTQSASQSVVEACEARAASSAASAANAI